MQRTFYPFANFEMFVTHVSCYLVTYIQCASKVFRTAGLNRTLFGTSKASNLTGFPVYIG